MVVEGEGRRRKEGRKEEEGRKLTNKRLM